MDFSDLLRNSKRTDIRGDVNTPPQLRQAGDNNGIHSDRLKLSSKESLREVATLFIGCIGLNGRIQAVA